MAIQWIIFGLLGVVFSQSEKPPLDKSSSGLTSPRPRYKVVTLQSEPWVMKSGHEYSGLIIDILNEIANISNFDYDLYESPDVKYGSINYHTGEFDGIISELQAGRADIGAADLTVTDARSQVVTFSSPFFETGAQILLRKPVKSQLSFEILLLPFSVTVWCLSIASFVVTGLLLYMIDRISPSGRKQIKTNGIIRQVIGLCNNSTFQENAKLTTPTSAKLLSKTWLCFTVTILVLYTSNLTCCLTASRTNNDKLPFKTFHGMVSQTDILYGGWFGMRLNLNDGLQRRMDRFISSRYTHYTTMEEAVSKIRSTNGQFAAIVNGYHGKDVVSKECDLVLLSEQLFSIYNSFACQKSHEGERICATVTQALLALREDGTLFSLFKLWFDKNSESKCSAVSEEEFESRDGQPKVSFGSLTLGETVPVFVLFLVGVLLTVVLLVAEIVWNRTRQKEEHHGTGLEETSQLTIRQSSNENDKMNTSRTSSNMSTTVASD